MSRALSSSFSSVLARRANYKVHETNALKSVATLPCNLSLVACFADINVSQGSGARCGGIFNMHLTANLPRYLPVKN